MKIINVKIEDFGCLSGKSFDLSPSFNLIVGNNESGKSTLLAFIKFIFYGLPRKSQENLSERERSFSWERGVASGSLTFSTDSGTVYTVERRAVRHLGEKRETVSEECRIIDEKSGVQVHKGESPWELFLGVPPSVFESTCFIRQAGVTDIRTADVGSALENILLSADETVDLQKSLDRLDGARKLLLHKSGKGGILSELEAEGDSLSLRLAKAKAGYAAILAKTEAADSMRRDASEKRKELDRLEDIFASMSKVDLIKRFDALHEKENELSIRESELADYRRSVASESGFIPDISYVNSLTEALGGYRSAKNEYSVAKQQLDRIGIAKEKAEGTMRASGNLTVEFIRSSGGADGICLGLKNAFDLSDKKKKRGGALLTVFALCLALGAILGGISFALSIPYLIYAAAGLAALSAVFAVAGLVSRSGAKKLQSETDARLTEYGAPPSRGLSVSDRLTLLRDLIMTVLEEDERLKKLRSELALADSAARLRHGDLTSAEERARSLIEKWKSPIPDGELSDLLTEIIGKAREVTERSDALFRDVVALRNQAEAMRAGLGSANEADLRARVSKEAIEAYESGDPDRIAREKKFCSEALRTMNEKVHETDKELLRLESETENPARLSVLLEENRVRYEKEKLRYDAVVMAEAALSEAGSNLRNSVSPLLRAKAETHMAILTDKKYESLGLDGDYSMTARRDDSGTRPIELLSAGTRDSAYLALRLALLEVIFRDEIPFLAVDEALAHLDDTRAAAALRLLASYCLSGGQCLLFTCHSREEALLEGITKVEVIRL